MSDRRLGDETMEPGFPRTPNDNWVSRYAAAWRLLDAVGARYPHVLESLDGYLQAFPQVPNETEDAIGWLREWARRSGLVCDLVLVAAAKTVWAWRHDPTTRGAWVFPDVQHSRLPLLRAIPEYPELVTRKDWIAIYDNRLAQLEAAGWTTTLSRDSQQFDWLADVTCGGLSYTAVAAAANRSVPAVYDRVTALASFIKLILPEAEPGGRKRLASRDRKIK